MADAEARSQAGYIDPAYAESGVREFCQLRSIGKTATEALATLAGRSALPEPSAEVAVERCSVSALLASAASSEEGSSTNDTSANG